MWVWSAASIKSTLDIVSQCMGNTHQQGSDDLYINYSGMWAPIVEGNGVLEGRCKRAMMLLALARRWGMKRTLQNVSLP